MTARLIICEKSGQWAAAFRRAATSCELPISETRGLQQVERELADKPASIAAIEVNAATAAKVAIQISAWQTKYPAARFLLLADRELEAIEVELREAAAVHVIYSTRDLAGPLRIVRRHLARAPQPPLSLEETILAALPWSSTKS